MDAVVIAIGMEPDDLLTETIVRGDLADGALLALVLDGDRMVGAAGTGR